MREAQIVKPRKDEVLETITSFQVKDVPKVKANPIRLKSRSRTPSGGMDRAVATSCLPVELCQERGLAVECTSDLPYTNASGAPVRVHGICHPKVTIGNQDGMFKAMDVAKPLLSVARLVNKGWEVCFKPGNSYMKFQDTTIPLEEKGGVYKIPLNLEGFQGHRAG